MSPKALSALIVVGLIALLASQSLYVVNETQAAIKLQFGEVVAEDVRPGLHVKIPLIQNVKRFDARVLTLDTPSARYLTSGKKYAIVDSFAQWHVVDVNAYYKATSGNYSQATELLTALLNKALRDEIASRTLHEVVSGERDSLMSKLASDLDKQSRKELGIAIIDVRIKAIDLPDDLSRSVYSRMSAERAREAREYRSQGKELSEGIEADADRQVVVISAEAYRKAEQTRGEGDAEATAIYAKAYNKDAEFYAFTRSLKAYTESFKNNDILLLQPDNQFFRYMQGAKAK